MRHALWQAAMPPEDAILSHSIRNKKAPQVIPQSIIAHAPMTRIPASLQIRLDDPAGAVGRACEEVRPACKDFRGEVM